MCIFCWQWTDVGVVTLLMGAECALSGDHGFDSGWGIINPLWQIIPCRSMFAKGRTTLYFMYTSFLQLCYKQQTTANNTKVSSCSLGVKCCHQCPWNSFGTYTVTSLHRPLRQASVHANAILHCPPRNIGVTAMFDVLMASVWGFKPRGMSRSVDW